MTLSRELYMEMYLKMQRIREFDMRINKLVRRGFVQGMTHFSVGEEAASVGAIAHLSYDDIIFSNHRGHGQSIAKDMDLNKMMAELAGKATGVSKGRGGSMHLADFEKVITARMGLLVVVMPLLLAQRLPKIIKKLAISLWLFLATEQPMKALFMNRST